MLSLIEDNYATPMGPASLLMLRRLCLGLLELLELPNVVIAALCCQSKSGPVASGEVNYVLLCASQIGIAFHRMHENLKVYMDIFRELYRQGYKV